MRRKDLLIIATAVIVISFLTVFAIHYSVNDGNIFSEAEAIVPKERQEYYANGWETSIIKEIRDNVPIPEGFAYVEGKEKTGLIIEDEITKEKYMWVPTKYTSEKAKEYIDVAKEKLNSESYEGENATINESTEKYGGFYVAIKDKEVAEEEYLKQNTKNFEEYKELKSKLQNKEIEAINFASINTEKYEEKIEAAKMKYEGAKAVESNAITKDQLANVLAWNEILEGAVYLDANQVVLGEKLKSDFSKGYEQFQQEFTVIYEELKDEENLDTRIKNLLELITKAENQETLESLWLQVKNHCMNDIPINGHKQNYKKYTGSNVDMDDEKAVQMFKDMFLDTENGLTAILDDNKDEKWDENYGDDYIDFFRYCFAGTKNNNNLNDAIDEAVEEYNENNNNNNSGNSEGAADVVKEFVNLSVNGKQMRVPIPEGFTYEKADKYVKIKNGNNLAFVWIPVEDNLDKVTSDFRENMRSAGLGTDEINAILETRGQETLPNEIKNSINKYKGFYISEAEVGKDRDGYAINLYREVEEKENGNLGVANGEYDRTLDANGAKQTAERCYADSEVVSSHLTYGVEWDALVNYIIHCGDLTAEEAFVDSNAKGKYKENIRYDRLLAGMFGIGGNLNDMTQETKDGKIVTRGGSYADEGTEYSSIASAKLVEANSNDAALTEQTGYRIVLTVNENRKVNENLQGVKDAAIREIEDYIKNGQWAYINVDMPIIVSIKNYIVDSISVETSTQIIAKLVDYGKKEISRVEIMLAEMYNYGVSAGYTYGQEIIVLNDEIRALCNKYGIDITNEAQLTVNNICVKIKEVAMYYIKNATYINYEGTNGGYENTFIIRDQIKIVADKAIEAVRKNCKEKIYNEEIEGYITNYHNDIANESWIQEIKAAAKEELMHTKDLVNIRSIAVKYQEKIEEGIREREEEDDDDDNDGGGTQRPSDSIVTDALEAKLNSMKSEGKIETWSYEGKTAYMILKVDTSSEIFKDRDERTFYYIGGEYLFMAKNTILGETKYGVSTDEPNPAGNTGNSTYDANVKKSITKRNNLIIDYIGGNNITVRLPIYKDMEKASNNDLLNIGWSDNEECWYNTKDSTGGVFKIQEGPDTRRYSNITTGDNGVAFYYRPVIDIDTTKGGDENELPPQEDEEPEFSPEKGTALYTLKTMYEYELAEHPNNKVLTNYGWIKKANGHWQECVRDGNLKSTKAPKDCILAFSANVMDLNVKKITERVFIQIGDIKDRKFIMRSKCSETDFNDDEVGAIHTRDRLWKDLGEKKYLTYVEIPCKEDYVKLFEYKIEDSTDKQNTKWNYGVKMDGEYELYGVNYDSNAEFGYFDPSDGAITTKNIADDDWTTYFEREDDDVVEEDAEFRLVVVLKSLK